MIGSVVEGLRRRYEHVVLIDDGSGDATADLARQSGATVLRHVLNRGQGAALQTGIDFALRCGADVIVTFDSDGQHVPDDVETLIAPLRAGRADVVLGSRFTGSARGIPLLRKALLSMAVVFTRLVSGARVTDTHNGLRAFTRDAAAILDIRLDRMAHASEILDQIMRHRLRFEEVPVHVVYTDYSRDKGQRSLGAFRVLVEYVFGRWIR